MANDLITENCALKLRIEQLERALEQLERANEKKEPLVSKDIKMFSSLIQEGFGSDKYKNSDEVIFDYSNISENFANLFKNLQSNLDIQFNPATDEVNFAQSRDNSMVALNKLKDNLNSFFAFLEMPTTMELYKLSNDNVVLNQLMSEAEKSKDILSDLSKQFNSCNVQLKETLINDDSRFNELFNAWNKSIDDLSNKLKNNLDNQIKEINSYYENLKQNLEESNDIAVESEIDKQKKLLETIKEKRRSVAKAIDENISSISIKLNDLMAKYKQFENNNSLFDSLQKLDIKLKEQNETFEKSKIELNKAITESLNKLNQGVKNVDNGYKKLVIGYSITSLLVGIASGAVVFKILPL